ncbi:MAG TPA: peptide ABC transporter permease [Bacteroidetes bacterium]|nr:peptide ABC transporter permease [Bacteroidota bacterium]
MSKALLTLAGLRESLAMALNAVRTNKLRSVLTLLGIVVGIFSIISVMTAMGVLRNSIEVGLNQLGANTFQIQKFPVIIGNDHNVRRRLRNRKDITYEQALAVREKATLAQAVGIEVWDFGKIVWWKGQRTNPNIVIFGENMDGIATNNWVVENGRSFTAQDMDLSKPVATIGKVVADKLFPPSVNPVGETIRIDGNLYEVIGVYATKGDVLGGNNDNFVVIPIEKYFEKYGKSGRSVNIMVQALSREVVDEAVEQARGILRIARNVPPGSEDDFAWFSNDSVVRQFDDFTEYLRLGVLLVSSIALLAAGVGIMNIMLVSVTERTREIGIRKAIGAQQRDVLSQFIMEAVILCEIGGLIGIVLGIIGGNVVGILMDIPAVIPWEWVGIGVMVCTVVGLVFGVYPAWKASALDPIEALRYE